jgi:hypothetical protein
MSPTKNFPEHLNDRNEYMDMVHWFSPKVLLKTLKKVLPSTLFGQYADRRLVHAALDSPINAEKIIETCCGGTGGVCFDNRSKFWVDYVADLGDGWDSTYSVAYLIGQKGITVDGVPLPRANCLIMGGDEVYPDASREDYRKRMQRPYRAAFPKQNTPRTGVVNPPVYLIPGNHDWYDGLTIFLARFCRGRPTPLGSWVASQRRSYFATHLANNWWIWGFDSQLGEDVDTPQADYFVNVAPKMEPNAKVIICASVPTWLRANLTAKDDAERERFYRGLDYIATIVRDECAGAKVPVVLAGDLHHYTRYLDKESGTNFINSGGGGAFLHPTHGSIEDVIPMKWTGQEQTLEIGRDGSDPEKKAIYPPADDSRKLTLGNLGFFYKNWDFSLGVMGALYAFSALTLLWWNGYGMPMGNEGVLSVVLVRAATLFQTPVFFLIAAGLIVLLGKTADIRSGPRRWFIATLHGLIHSFIILFGTALIAELLAAIPVHDIPVIGQTLYLLFLIVGMVLLGFLGGFVWGLYLTAVSYRWGDEANNAFSALRLGSYQNFIRMKVEGDTITIYPIGIDKAPEREEWESNPAYVDADPDQDTPAIVAKNGVLARLIEAPIVIDTREVAPIKG